MLKGKAKFLGVRTISGKRGDFRVARFGNEAECTHYELFVKDDLNIPLTLKVGHECELVVSMSQNGYKLSATLVGIGK